MISKNEMNDIHKKSRREAAYLAGKPIRIRWWTLLLYMIPCKVFIVFILYDLIVRDITPFEGLARWEIFFGLAIFNFPALFAAMRMLQMVVIKENGLFVRDCLGKTHNIPYFAIKSYAIDISRPSAGITIYAYGKKHYFRFDLAGYKYLRDEVRRRVGADKEVQ